jgi:hypothetical protein
MMQLPVDREMNPAAKNSGRTIASAVTTFNLRRCTARRSGTSLSITCGCAPISPALTSARSRNFLNRHRAEACAITAFASVRATIKSPLLRVPPTSSQEGGLDRKRCQGEHYCSCTKGPIAGCWDCKADNRAFRCRRNRLLPLD